MNEILFTYYYIEKYYLLSVMSNFSTENLLNAFFPVWLFGIYFENQLYAYKFFKKKENCKIGM